MTIKDFSKEELEVMSYAELTQMILTEKGSKMKIVDIFKKICKALELSDAEFENKIGDFFELISTDKNFVVLDKGFCDLKIKHNSKVIIEDEDDEIIDSDSSDEEVIEEENSEEDIFYDSSSEEDDVEDNENELTDFIMVDEEEETSM